MNKKNYFHFYHVMRHHTKYDDTIKKERKKEKKVERKRIK